MATAAFAVSQGSIRHSEECAIYPLFTHELTYFGYFCYKHGQFCSLGPITDGYGITVDSNL